MNFNAHIADDASAVLKDFFDAYPDADDLRPRLFSEIEKSENGFAVREEIIDDQKFIIG